MIPHYQAWHMRQLVGLEGPDLAGMQWQEILATARGIFRDSVRAAWSVGEFASQKTIRRVQRGFLEVCAIRSEVLSEVGLKGTQEKEEMGHKTAQNAVQMPSIQQNHGA